MAIALATRVSGLHNLTTASFEDRSLYGANPTIGVTLRSLRARKGPMLKQMSEPSGIPLSTLVRMEHDRLTLIQYKLLQLNRRQDISKMFPEQGAPEPTVCRSSGRIEGVIRLDTPNYDYFRSCPELRRNA